MDDSKNFLTAIVLMIAVLFIYQLVFQPAPVVDTQVTESEQSAENLSLTDNGQASPNLAGQDNIPQDAQEPAPRIHIETPRLEGSINLRGGRIDDLILRDYYTNLNREEEIRLLRPRQGVQGYLAETGWAGVAGSGISLPTSQTVWSTTDTELSVNSPVTLTWNNGAGLVFERIISVDENYLFTIEDRVSNNQGEALRIAPFAFISRTGRPDTQGFFILHEGPLGVFDEGLEEVDYSDLDEDGPQTYTATGGWIGVTDKYWLTALVPPQDQTVQSRFLSSTVGPVQRYRVDTLQSERIVEDGQGTSSTIHVFAGAKEVDLIDSYEKDYNIRLFDRTIDWGWFYFLTRPIFYTLDWLYGLFGNFGVAILLLTVFIKILFFPLANKSYVSMSKMKLLGPKMKQLKERYSDDPARQQQEIMGLYRKEKVNPLAGCLPILVQIPVFFALYKTLFVTIEMRHQPFFGWVQDLSAPDPLTIITLFGLVPWNAPEFLQIGIWPLLMGLSMYLQQKLNPQAPDPVQAKIFLFMPVLFTFLLARFPVGLVIYWTWNNALSILQQWLIMRKMGVKVSDDE